MKSLASQEGYLLIDNRFTPGFSDEHAARSGLPAGAGKGVFETKTYTCSHCGTVVVKNPVRDRERAFCRGCSHLICDNCGAVRAANGGRCRTFTQLIEEVQDMASKGIIVPDNFIHTA